jgi:hypothetical protein
MSNTIKALIAIVSIIILGSGIFVFTRSRSVENLSNQDISSPVSSSSKSTVLSSGSQTVSISFQSISKVTQVSSSFKTEIVQTPSSQTAQTQKCNQLDSPDLIKTEDGCFKMAYSVGPNTFFKWENTDPNVEPNSYLLYNSESNVKIAKDIAKDFFDKFKEKVVINDPKYSTQLNIGSVNRKNDIFTINTYISNQVIGENDAKILRNIIGEYEIYKDLDGTWRWKFIKQIN